jgi:hypothetical protein
MRPRSTANCATIGDETSWCVAVRAHRAVAEDPLEQNPSLQERQPVDTLQTYLYFLMIHACFTPIALCFVYTRDIFMYFLELTY